MFFTATVVRLKEGKKQYTFMHSAHKLWRFFRKASIVASYKDAPGGKISEKRIKMNSIAISKTITNNHFDERNSK